jgi:dynein heavy chain, axonemal
MSNPETPIVIILSSGANPIDEILNLGGKMEMTKRIHSISLGQEQAPIAEKIIDVAIDRGENIPRKFKEYS